MQWVSIFWHTALIFFLHQPTIRTKNSSFWNWIYFCCCYFCSPPPTTNWNRFIFSHTKFFSKCKFELIFQLTKRLNDRTVVILWNARARGLRCVFNDIFHRAFIQQFKPVWVMCKHCAKKWKKKQNFFSQQIWCLYDHL